MHEPERSQESVGAFWYPWYGYPAVRAAAVVLSIAVARWSPGSSSGLPAPALDALTHLRSYAREEHASTARGALSA